MIVVHLYKWMGVINFLSNVYQPLHITLNLNYLKGSVVWGTGVDRTAHQSTLYNFLLHM